MAGPQPIPQKRSLPGRRAAPSGFIARLPGGWGGGGSVAERGGDDFEAVAGFPFILRPDGRLEAGCFFGGAVGVDEALHRIGAQAEVADRGIPDADPAPVAGVADIDAADVAPDLAAAAVDRRPIGTVQPVFAFADAHLDHPPL